MIDMTNIEDELKRFYAENTPPIDPDEKHRVVEMVARASQKDSSAPTAESISFRRFVLTQVRFINPICWILQIALIACVLITGDIYKASEIQAPLVMTFAMLTVVIAIPSAFKSFESKTAELELACRFNSAQVEAHHLRARRRALVLNHHRGNAIVCDKRSLQHLPLRIYAVLLVLCSVLLLSTHCKQTRDKSGNCCSNGLGCRALAVNRLVPALV